MDPAATATATATDPISRPKPNGILARKQHHPIIRHPQPHPSPPPPPPPPPPHSLYGECLKNHAASLGGHALDGCGEFMPSPYSNPSDPSSLTCSACGCHRNFHRRALLCDYDMEDSGGGGGASSQNDDTDEGGGAEVDLRNHSTSPPPPSAPHMLLALSTGGGSSPAAGPAAGAVGAGFGVGVGVGVGGVQPRKRFRSKFRAEQKERMQELSERLGWRMQKRDEGIVEETCREIGVGKGVFKVWMHNNKHNFAPKNNSNSNNSNNALSSSVDASAGTTGELCLCGEGLLHHHHHRHNDGVNGCAD